VIVGAASKGDGDGARAAMGGGVAVAPHAAARIEHIIIE